MLIGGLSAAAVTGCGPGSGNPPPLSAENVYTNNFYVPGVGYYHAPFRAWYSLPYNHFDPQTQRYFYGGQWSQSAGQTVQVAQLAEAQRTDIQRGGFGGGSGFFAVHS